MRPSRTADRLANLNSTKLNSKGLAVFALLLLCLFQAQPGFSELGQLRIGTGLQDITGPAAERGMLGYADLKQLTRGIHSRLNARAFVIEDPSSNRRVAFVVADLGMVFHSVKKEVLRQLEAEFPGKYQDSTVLISATHTHSGPGGFSHHDLFNVTTLGFDQKNFETIAEGIFKAIRDAHRHLAPGTIRLAEGELKDVSINRSVQAYRANRDWREFDTETDTSNLLLRFTLTTGEDIGELNWFSVHPVSMSRKNSLISSDSSGYAATLFEKVMRAQRRPVPNGEADIDDPEGLLSESEPEADGAFQPESTFRPSRNFVAGFASANEGDSSPNIFPKDSKFTDFDKTREIGLKRFGKAMELFQQADHLLAPRIEYRHVWVDMPSLTLQGSAGDATNKLCPPAVGYSFVAGADDGPTGIPGYHQGMKQGPEFVAPFPIDPAAAVLAGIIGGSRHGKKCHFPKPVFLASSKLNPDLIPQRLPFQLWILGDLAIAGVPSELTTMAGRRLKSLLRHELESVGVKYIAIAGLSNEYSGYVTTPEEYGEQRYEGAFTLYGPNTLQGYLETFSKLAESVRTNKEITIDGPPAPRKAKLMDWQTGVVFDGKRIKEKFGDVVVQPNLNPKRGETITAKFRAGHPKNSLGSRNRFFQVQYWQKKKWVTVARDQGPEVYFTWERDHSLGCIACSTVTVYWNPPADSPVGKYRIQYSGVAKAPTGGKLIPFLGSSAEFLLTD